MHISTFVFTFLDICVCNCHYVLNICGYIYSCMLDICGYIYLYMFNTYAYIKMYCRDSVYICVIAYVCLCLSVVWCDMCMLDVFSHVMMVWPCILEIDGAAACHIHAIATYIESHADTPEVAWHESLCIVYVMRCADLMWFDVIWFDMMWIWSDLIFGFDRMICDMFWFESTK